MEWNIFITLGTILTTFFAVYYFLEKREEKNTNIHKENMEETRKNTEQLIEFNANLKHMRDNDIKRDEIQKEHSETLINHDKRLLKLEYKKEYTNDSGR